MTNLSQWVPETNLRRVDGEILEGVESDEDVAHVGVHLQLVVPLLQVPDDGLLQEGGESANQTTCTSTRSMQRDKRLESHLVQELQVH